jgi:hypothetical protein
MAQGGEPPWIGHHLERYIRIEVHTERRFPSSATTLPCIA